MSIQLGFTIVLFVALCRAAFSLISPCSSSVGGNVCEWHNRRRHQPTLILQAKDENHLQTDGGFSDDSRSPTLGTSHRLLLKVSYDGRKLKRSKCSAEAVMSKNLAKLYGNVSPQRIVIQTSIDLVGGSHAVGLVMQVSCLAQDNMGLMPLPKHPSDMCHALNRMCHETLQVKSFAYPPQQNFTSSAFDSASYLYRISVGSRPDPIQKDHVWHLKRFSGSPTVQSMQATCNALKDQTPSIHDIWCEESCDTWSTDTISVNIHIVISPEQPLNILDYIASIVKEPLFAPAHGLVLTAVNYKTQIEWFDARRYVRSSFE